MEKKWWIVIIIILILLLIVPALSYYKDVLFSPKGITDPVVPTTDPTTTKTCPIKVDCLFLASPEPKLITAWQECVCPQGCRATGHYGYNCTGFVGPLGAECGATKGFDDRVLFTIRDDKIARVGVYCDEI